MTRNERRACPAHRRTTADGHAAQPVRATHADRAAAWLVTRFTTADRERGDVPGWVLVTLMTAGLVSALWLVAQPLLKDVFDSAIKGVTKP